MTRAVLFDLDGTLVASGPSIIASIHHAMQAIGRPLYPDQNLSWVVGPPLRDIFARLLDPADSEQIEAASAAYRGHYDGGGLLQVAPYPGIAAVLETFRAEGFAVLVATSKPAHAARRILTHLGLADKFRAIYGAAGGGALAHKPELIAYVLATQGLDPARTVMIGDRSFDISGAHANELRAIGVLWGYGDSAELEQAGADALAETPADLLDQVAHLLHPR